jgi:hypothetical protein
MNGGLNEDARAGLPGAARTGGYHLSGRFVTEHLRIGHRTAADAPLRVPVQIAAADADGAYADKHLAGPRFGRHGGFL